MLNSFQHPCATVAQGPAANRRTWSLKRVASCSARTSPLPRQRPGSRPADGQGEGCPRIARPWRLGPGLRRGSDEAACSKDENAKQVQGDGKRPC